MLWWNSQTPRLPTKTHPTSPPISIIVEDWSMFLWREVCHHRATSGLANDKKNWNHENTFKFEGKFYWRENIFNAKWMRKVILSGLDHRPWLHISFISTDQDWAIPILSPSNVTSGSRENLVYPFQDPCYIRISLDSNFVSIKKMLGSNFEFKPKRKLRI